MMDRGRKEREGKEEEVAVTGPALWLLARQHCWLWLRGVCLYVSLVGHCPLLLMPWAHLVMSAAPSSFLTSVYLCVKTDEGWICFFRLRTVVSCTHLEKRLLFLPPFFKAIETLCFKESRLTAVCAILPTADDAERSNFGRCHTLYRQAWDCTWAPAQRSSGIRHSWAQHPVPEASLQLTQGLRATAQARWARGVYHVWDWSVWQLVSMVLNVSEFSHPSPF